MSLLLLSEADSSQLLWETLFDSASQVRVLWYKLLVAAVRTWQVCSVTVRLELCIFL